MESYSNTSNKLTFAEKVTEAKRDYLRALRAGKMELSLQIKAVVLMAEKLGYPPDGQYPIFFDFTNDNKGNFLVKSSSCGLENNRQPAIFTKAEFEALQHLKQTIIWIDPSDKDYKFSSEYA